MNLNSISLQPILAKTVAILGYGNQGRAQALNLRDSGVSVRVGARAGVGSDLALKDGFQPISFEHAIKESDVVLYLFPDQIIPEVYRDTKRFFKQGQKIGFAHGFCYHFKWIEVMDNCQYFLVGSKGAGAVLRDAFERGSGLPGVYALGEENIELESLVQSYAKAIGLTSHVLLKTTFQEETECDLFGEQVVLCGGLMQLMESAFETLVDEGFNPEMAFLECCYEAKTIIELWMKYGPYGLTQKISPTAFFGGLTRGKRIINEETKTEIKKIFKEIRSGEFAKEWKTEVEKNEVQMRAERERVKSSQLEAVYRKLNW
jgi:ketol-acid reductoisomerase